MNFKKRLLSILLIGIIPAVTLLACSNTTTETTASQGGGVETTETTAGSEEPSGTDTDASTSELAVINEGTSTFGLSEGLDEKGFWKGIKALDYVTLSDYKNIPVSKEIHTVTDEQVQAEVDFLLDQASTTKQVLDKAIAHGDRVNIDYVGSIDGVAFEGGSTNGAGTEVVIGETQYIDDFLEQLEGHKPGEQFDIQVTFPEDYGQPDLNGKEATFAITINYIVEEVKPELTDDYVAKHFAASTGWKSVAELKEKLHKNMQAAQISVSLQQDLIEDSTVTDIPKALLDYQENAMLSYFQNQADTYGMGFEELIQFAEGVTTREELVAKYEDQNKRNAEYSLIIQAIAEDAQVSVSPEDISTYFKEKMGILDPKNYEEQFGKPYLVQVVLVNKVVDFLIDNAKLE